MKKALELTVAVTCTVVTYVLLVVAFIMWLPQIPIGICVGIYYYKHQDQPHDIVCNGWQAAKRMPGVQWITEHMFPKC